MNSYIKRAMLFLQDIIFTVKCPYCEKVIDRNDSTLVKNVRVNFRKKAMKLTLLEDTKQ